MRLQCSVLNWLYLCSSSGVSMQMMLTRMRMLEQQ